MPEGMGPTEWLSVWQEGQRAFWSAAAESGVADAAAFAPADWRAFDDLMAHVLTSVAAGDQGATWQAAHHAGARYRDVVQGAFGRIQSAFSVQCRAIYGDAGQAVPDWRLLRQRWFDIAEAEFIRTLRAPEYVAAQRDVIRAAIELWSLLPDEARHLAQNQRRLAATARQTLVALGADLVPIARTPRELVWEAGRTTLWRYRPFVAAPHLGPVLICHGLIGRQTMTDLRPERSLVRNLLAAGVDVLVLDWGNAGPEDADLGLDHFVGDRLPAAIAAALAATGAPRLVLFGICQGGTLAASHAALDSDSLSGLITAVAPFDFHADSYDADPAHGLLHHWARSLDEVDIEALIGMEGNLSGDLIGMIFNQLNPVRTLAKYAVEMLDHAGDPASLTTFLAMENWLADRPDLPGALARTWLIDFYQRNALMDDAVAVAGRTVKLSRIDVPVLNVFATGDHIIPPPCSRALGRALSGRDYTELALPTGHVGAFVSARSQALLGPSVVQWLSR